MRKHIFREVTWLAQDQTLHKLQSTTHFYSASRLLMQEALGVHWKVSELVNSMPCNCMNSTESSLEHHVLPQSHRVYLQFKSEHHFHTPTFIRLWSCRWKAGEVHLGLFILKCPVSVSAYLLQECCPSYPYMAYLVLSGTSCFPHPLMYFLNTSYNQSCNGHQLSVLPTDQNMEPRTAASDKNWGADNEKGQWTENKD